ncbi:MAG: GAP family protein [Candidatus Nanopelagicales bacterium]
MVAPVPAAARDNPGGCDALSLLLQVLPLAIGAAISPTFLAMQVVVLTSGASGALRRGWALAVGSMSGLLLISFGGLSLLSGLPDVQTGKASYPEAAILIIGGLALLIIGAVTIRRPPAPIQNQPGEGIMAKVVDARPPVLFGIGFLRLIVNATTLALYIPALHVITQSSNGNVVKALVFVVLFAITEIAVVGPVLAVTLLGERAKPVLTGIHEAIQRHSKQLTVTTCLGFGLLLLALGVQALLQVA